jgi:hypothetical protein
MAAGTGSGTLCAGVGLTVCRNLAYPVPLFDFVGRAFLPHAGGPDLSPQGGSQIRNRCLGVSRCTRLFVLAVARKRSQLAT